MVTLPDLTEGEESFVGWQRSGVHYRILWESAERLSWHAGKHNKVQFQFPLCHGTDVKQVVVETPLSYYLPQPTPVQHFQMTTPPIELPDIDLPIQGVRNPYFTTEPIATVSSPTQLDYYPPPTPTISSPAVLDYYPPHISTHSNPNTNFDISIDLGPDPGFRIKGLALYPKPSLRRHNHVRGISQRSFSSGDQPPQVPARSGHRRNVSSGDFARRVQLYDGGGQTGMVSRKIGFGDEEDLGLEVHPLFRGNLDAPPLYER